MQLFDTSDPSVLWLNLTNAALGIVMAISIGVIVLAVAKEILVRIRAGAPLTGPMPQQTPHFDDHAFQVPELGLTMADGGEPAGKPQRKARPRAK